MTERIEDTAAARRPLVLLVNSDADSREIFRDALVHAGYGVISAPTGAEGLDMAHADRPDVILGDFPMDVPGHSPFVADVRGDRHLDGARILVVTARAMADQVARAWEVADDVLVKPIDPKYVVEAVRKLAGPPRG